MKCKVDVPTKRPGRRMLPAWIHAAGDRFCSVAFTFHIMFFGQPPPSLSFTLSLAVALGKEFECENLKDASNKSSDQINYCQTGLFHFFVHLLSSFVNKFNPFVCMLRHTLRYPLKNKCLTIKNHKKSKFVSLRSKNQLRYVYIFSD